MNAIYILWLRELKRFFRSRVQIIIAMAQPVFFLFGVGFGLGPVFERAGEGNYLQFMAPGVIGMTVLFSSVFSGVAILWDRQFGFLKETLVSPVPRLYVMIGRTLGGATVAIIQGFLILLVCLIAGFRPQHWTGVFIAFPFVAMIAIAAAALGTTMGSIIQDVKGFQLTINLLVMPMFFLSGALYPLSDLSRVLSFITKLDPLSYGVDGLRGSLIGLWHFSYAVDLGLLFVVAVMFLMAGAYLFSRIDI
jgi:ABC-2 type transport system permease protein